MVLYIRSRLYVLMYVYDIHNTYVHMYRIFQYTHAHVHMHVCTHTHVYICTYYCIWMETCTCIHTVHTPQHLEHIVSPVRVKSWRKQKWWVHYRWWQPQLWWNSREFPTHTPQGTHWMSQEVKAFLFWTQCKGTWPHGHADVGWRGTSLQWLGSDSAHRGPKHTKPTTGQTRPISESMHCTCV